MIYKIANKYYVNISPMIFSEVNLVVNNGKVILKPVGKKIEVNKNTEIIQVNLDEEKARLLKKTKTQGDTPVEYRPNKRNRRK